MSRGFQIDSSRMRARVTALDHALRGRLRDAMSEIREVVIETAIEMAQAFADRTFPNGYGFKLAKAQLLHELSTLYATGGKVYQKLSDAGEKSLAGRFYHAYKRGDMAAAAGYLRQSATSWSRIPCGDLDPGLHERARNPQTGQITVSQPWQIVPEDQLKFYQSLAIRRLGKTASGWNAAAESLGGDGNKPKWKGTAIHGPDGGYAKEVRDKQGYHVVLTNRRKLARKHLSPGQKAAIVRRARRNLADRLVKGPIAKIKRRRTRSAA